MHTKCIHIECNHTGNKVKHGFHDSHHKLEEHFNDRGTKDILNSLVNKRFRELDPAKPIGQKNEKTVYSKI